jgi:hypothetical protein
MKVAHLVAFSRALPCLGFHQPVGADSHYSFEYPAHLEKSSMRELIGPEGMR